MPGCEEEIGDCEDGTPAVDFTQRSEEDWSNLCSVRILLEGDVRIFTAKPRTKILIVRVPRMDDVLWNSSSMIDIPGATTEDERGLGGRVSWSHCMYVTSDLP